MDAELYEALISGGAGDKGSIIAQALRRRNMMGQLGQITGDKFLAPTGKGLSSSADDYAAQLQQTRQNDIRQKQSQEYQTGQLKHMDAVLAETKRNNDMDHEYQMLMAAAAGARAENAGKGKIPKLRQGDIKELQDLGNTLGAIDGLTNFLNEGGSFGAVKVGKIPLPGARAFKNYAASKGFGSDEDKASFLAKQNWDRLYNLAERNRLFGATLTETERKSWDSANPSIAQTDEQIKMALPIMRKVFQHRLEKKSSGLLKEGYSGEALADYADIPGVNLPVAEGSDQGQPAAPKKRIKVDSQGNVIGD